MKLSSAANYRVALYGLRMLFDSGCEWLYTLNVKDK